MAEESAREGDHQEGDGLAQRTAVVIVTRNGLGLTKAAVKSALAQDVPVDLLVVDNVSTDGTRDWLKTKSFQVIYADRQWALAKCWNVALRALWKQGHDRALVLNNDVEIRPDAARLLSEHGGEFVTCVSVDSLDRIGTPGDRDIEELRKGQRERPDFSAWMIRKSVTDRSLWFNEELFPCYYDDNFFHVECHRKGVRCVCIDLPFYHVGASTLKNSDPAESERIKRGAGINRQKFFQKYKCLPATNGYENLFSESSFGVDHIVTPKA